MYVGRKSSNNGDVRKYEKVRKNNAAEAVEKKKEWRESANGFTVEINEQ